MTMQSLDHNGRVMTLCDAAGFPVKPGRLMRSFSGEIHTIRGGLAPQKQGSTGKVWTDRGEYYPSVFDLQWASKCPVDLNGLSRQELYFVGFEVGNRLKRAPMLTLSVDDVRKYMSTDATDAEIMRAIEAAALDIDSDPLYCTALEYVADFLKAGG